MKIEHIAKYVKDLEAARTFFVTYFGAVFNERYHNKMTDFQSYFLKFEDGYYESCIVGLEGNQIEITV